LKRALEKVKATLVTESADILGKAILAGFGGLLVHYRIPIS
jgi:hypothetical protein